MSERSRRLFFAYWPSIELRRAIVLETHAAVLSAGGRAIPAENFHITLAFLGSVANSRVGDLIAVARSVPFEPFRMLLGQVTWWAKQRLLCLEPIEGAAELGAVATLLQEELRKLGFAIERRPFRAHLTLAREVPGEPVCKAPPSNGVRELSERMERIVLVESQITEKGSNYMLVAER